MKNIKIYFCGFWMSFNFMDNFIVNTLKKKYNVIIDKNPDYVFFTRFDSEIYKYKCVRIFYNAENFAADFNLCDYAIGFDELTFGDRYLRYPLYLVSDYTYYPTDNYAKDMEEAKKKHLFSEEDLHKKDGFCSIVVSREGCNEREIFFEKLNEYKAIASGGRWNNNVGGAIKDKLEFTKKFKFSIAFENSSTPGYTTEKLMQAFAAQTIPIYYGNPYIGREFNEDAFINVHCYNSWDDVVEEVKRIDLNDELYMKMIKSQTFVSGMIEKKELELQNFLFHIVDQNIENAKRRHGQLIQKYERKYMVGTMIYLIIVKIHYLQKCIISFIKREEIS